MQLNNASQAHMTEILCHATDNNESSGEGMGSNYPSFKMVYNDEASAVIKSMYNYTALELYEI